MENIGMQAAPSRGRRVALTVAMCLGIALVMLDTTIMNIALPAMQHGLGVGLDRLSWALNVYTIIVATCTIPLSRLADIYGRGRLFVVGLLLFGAGSLIAGMAPGFGVLIAGRVVSGLGASVLLPVANALGISAWGVKDRVKVVAALGLTQGGAAAVGPTVGGIVTDRLSWNWIFLVNVPIVAVALILSFFALDLKGESRIQARIDWLGSIVSMAGLFVVTFGLIESKNWGMADPRVWMCLGVGVVAVVLFVLVERHVSSPMVDLRLFRFRQFTAAALVALIAQFFYIGVLVILPTFFTAVQGRSELNAAMILLPMSLTVFAFGGFGGLAINKLGPRLLVLAGLFAVLASYVLLAIVNPVSVTAMALAALVLGVGFGVIAGPINVLAASSLQGELLTASQSVISVVRQIGSVLGVSVFVSMTTRNITALPTHTPQAMTGAYIGVYRIWIPVLALCLLLALLFPRKRKYLRELSVGVR
ncbi:MFS transporter [Bifidobacterium sp. ESL0763]|uniref:MFS transporter n=1 Tax=Bifidobacterium sp. ESL0763 TaxID=2983227 RepID=UPI0023F8FF04|nr:MFS transporter [Bifidobacterium sp. ESL0763]MDF7663494.1 MFS transporter [Bifidobacterium sp. ESL0763]